MLRASRPLQRVRELDLQRRLDGDLVPADRVREAKSVCVQELTLQPEVAPDPVDRVAADGKGDRLEVHPTERRITLLHPERFEYYRLLRSKLHWGRGSFNKSE